MKGFQQLKAPFRPKAILLDHEENNLIFDL